MSAEWIQRPLGDVITLQRGHDLPSQDRNNGTVPIMGSSGLTGYHDQPKAPGPGVVVGRSGNSMGEVNFCPTDYWPLNTALYVTDFKGNDERFIYYLLKTIDFEQFNSGSAQKSLNRNAVYPYEVNLPRSVEEQKRISSILACLEAKLELNNNINQTLEQMAQVIFKSWFVDFEPVKAKITSLETGGSAADAELAAMQAISGKNSAQLEQIANEQPEKHAELRATAGMFPSAMQESELGEIPKGWSPSLIGEEVTVVGGGTPSTKTSEYWEEGGIHWTTPKDLSNLNDKILIDTERKITSAGLAKISSGLLPIDTVLMSSRAPVGYLALAKVPVAVNQGYIAMKCEKRLTPEYVLQWCESRMDEIKNRASGTTFAEISKKNFNAIPVVVPHQSLILAYTKQAKSIYNKIEMLAKESKVLADLRDTLLPQLLSGSITVKGMEV